MDIFLLCLQCSPSWHVWRILQRKSLWFIGSMEIFWRVCVETLHIRTLLDLRCGLNELDRNNVSSDKVVFVEA